VTRTTRGGHGSGPRDRRASPRPLGRHQAVWQRKTCDACGAPVRVAEEKLDSGRLRAALIERDPVEDALLVRDADGYLVRDYKHVMDGRRWAWHNCPVRNAADQVKP
jgi:hypothetical protein